MKHERLEQALSRERFSRYLAWAQGDRALAIELYSMNTRLSEALYTPLQTLEVVLLNRIHAVMCERYGEDWLYASSGVVIGPYQAAQVAKAIEELLKEGKEVTAAGLVSSLTFSFWTTMFHKDYEVLWQQGLHRIADASAPRGLKRKSFSGSLTRIRLLRNRIAHHEPILAWDLRKHHDRMLEMIQWLSPSAATWCREHDRFPQLMPAEAIVPASGARAQSRPPQVSRRVTLRLKTGVDGVWSRRSATK